MRPTWTSLREQVIAWPGVTEDLKWSVQHCFLVGTRIFLVVTVGDEDPGAVTFSASKDEQAEWLGVPGCRAAPYLGHAGWVTVAPGALDEARLLACAASSWLRIAKRLTRRERDALGVDTSSPPVPLSPPFGR